MDTAAETQAVPIGPLLLVLPRRFSEWRWGSDGPHTLVLHRLPGRPPDAWLYARAFEARKPSLSDMAAFLLAVDAPLTRLPEAAARLETVVASLAGRSLADGASTTASLGTATLGRGLGYVSRDSTFTGWRWVGRNGADVMLRLARTEGETGPPGPLADDLVVQLRMLADREPAMTSFIERLLAPPAGEPTPSGAATMVFGSIEAPGAAGGAFVAAVCRQPGCPVARELEVALDGVRLARLDDRSAASQESTRADIGALASEAGLALAGEAAVKRLSEAAEVLGRPRVVEGSEPARSGEAP